MRQGRHLPWLTQLACESALACIPNNHAAYCVQDKLGGDMGAEGVSGSIQPGPLTTVVAYMVLKTGFGRNSVLLDAGVAAGRWERVLGRPACV